MSKAQRIHDEQRLKAKRSRYASAGKSALQTPTLCSCPMCGNPRKHFGLRTIQERRDMQA